MNTALLAAALLSLSVSAEEKAQPTTAADDVVAAAFKKDIGTKSEVVKASDTPNLIVPGLALAALGVLAFTLKRRKANRLGGASITIVEAASLGEKRSLVIADVMGERLVLGVSEAGVTVLMNKPAPQGEPAPIIIPQADRAPVSSSQAMGFFDRLKGKNAAPAFDAALQESVEDQELRAKLQAGFRSVVP